MPVSIFRSWIKKLGGKLLSNSGCSSRVRSGGADHQPALKMRPTLELLEARVVPTNGAVSFNETTYTATQLQTAINAAEASGLVNPTITITDSCVGGVTVGAFTNGTTGTLEITGAYGAAITAPTSGAASTSHNALIDVTGGVSVELKGLDITGAAANPNLTYGVYTSGLNTSVNINNTTIQDIGSGSQTGPVYGVYVTGSAALTLTSSTITSISASTSGDGGVGVGILDGSSANLMSDTITAYQETGIYVTGAAQEFGLFDSVTGPASSATITSTTVTGANNAVIGISADVVSNVTATNDVITNNDHGLYDGQGSSLTGTYDTITGNGFVSANGGAFGGGVDNVYGTLTLSNSTIAGNSAYSGGGIFNNQGTVTLSNDTLSNNTASYGGGISNVDAAPSTLSSTTITGNSASVAGGSIYNLGSLTLSNDRFSGNLPAGSGNGIDNAGTLTYATASVSIGATTYGSLQAAINAASGSNPTITITGPCVGGVTVPSGGFTGTLTITGGVGGTITAPAVASPHNALISVTTGVSVLLSNLDITGASASPNVEYGVYVYGSGTSVSIRNSTIQDIGNSSQTGDVYGAYVADSAYLTMTSSTVTNIADSTSSFGGIGVQIGDSTLSGAAQLGFATLQNDSVNNYQQYGILINGANGSASSSATIADSTVTGIGPSPYYNTSTYYTYFTGAVGIQIDGGAVGTIEDTTITGNHDDNGTLIEDMSCGILITDGSSTTSSTVLDSVVSDNDMDLFTLNTGASITCVGDTFNGGIDPAGSYDYSTDLTYGQFGVDVYLAGDTAMTLSNSYVSGGQAGIVAQGDLVGSSPMTIIGTTICNNDTGPNCPFSGGGVSNFGSDDQYGFVMSNDLIYGNTATHGGGGYESGGGSDATITDTAITNNVTEYSGGGGIYTWGNGYLTLSNCTIANNSAAYGGGIYNAPQLSSQGFAYSLPVTLSNCTISGNSAQTSGGGINNQGSMILSNCSVIGNTGGTQGGGIANSGVLTLSNTTISGNLAPQGAGIFNIGASETYTYPSAANHGTSATYTYPSGAIYLAGSLSLSNSTVSGNTATGGYYLAVQGGAVIPGDGGGIYAWGGSVSVTNSTIAGNRAAYGGGVYINQAAANAGFTAGGVAFSETITGGSLSLSNATVSANAATSSGGGVTINNGTLTVVTVQNSIVAGNAAMTDPDIQGPVASSSNYNLIGIGNGLTGIGNGGINHNQIGVTGSPINADLSTLATNGGLTQTIALMPGSPAIDAGGGSYLATDQRGNARDGTPDIGAFQLSSGAATSLSLSISGSNVVATLTFSGSDTSLTSETVDFLDTATNYSPAAYGGSGGYVTINTSLGNVTLTEVNANTYTATLPLTSLSSFASDDSGGNGGLNAITATYQGDSSLQGSTAEITVANPGLVTNTTSLPITATSMTIAGYGFDTSSVANNVVTFNDGVTGMVTAASSSSLTVSLTGLASVPVGTALVATLTVDSGGFSSLNPVEVGIVAPVVTPSSAILPNTSATLTIAGSGFDSTTANDIVSFSNEVTGTVSSATSTSLTVSLTGLSSVTNGTALDATVTVDGASSASGVQVATIAAVAPTVTLSTANLPNNASTITIAGTNFSPLSANDTVAFNLGAVGVVTTATATSLTVGFSTDPTTAGNLTAVVTVSGSGSSSSTQVAVVTAPLVSPAGTNDLPINASTITIGGNGFSTTSANDTVAFNLGAVGTVTTATATSLTVAFTTGPTSVGSLTASVTVSGVGISSAVQVATVVPVVATNSAGLFRNDTSMTIGGYGFATNPAQDSITFSNTGVTGTIVGATSTSLTVSLSGLSSLPNDTALGASVTIDGVSSGSAVQVATVDSSFGVDSITATPDGVVLQFNAPIDPESTVLYSSPGDTTLGVADVTMVGATTGAVRGSLVIDPTDPDMATFLQTSGLLASDIYTVSVADAVEAVGGYKMIGNFSTMLTVTIPTTPVLSVPAFARGPGQSVALSNTTGIPVNISNAADVTQASFTLTYDPTLLTIASTGALSLSAAATTAGLTISSSSIASVDAHHSVLTVDLSGGTGLTATSATPLVTILASVPTTAPYLDKEVLNLSSVLVNSANAKGVSSVSVVAYPGDVLGTGLPNATDASLVDQVGSGSGSGFSKFKDLDPVIIGGVGGGLFLNANDASLIDEAASGAKISQIPSIPVGVSLTFGGPDPYLYMSAVQGNPGQTVTETLYLDVTDPNGIQLTALDEAIGFDAGALQISDVRGTSALAALGSYETASTVDNGSGAFLVGQAFMGTGLPPVVPYGTDIPVLQFNVTLNADLGVGSESGLTLLQVGTVNNVTQYTAISDNEGALTWTPGKAPSNSGNPAIDGSVTVVIATAPVVSEAVAVTQENPVAVLPKVVEPVRRVTPVPATPVDETVPTAPATTVRLVVPLVRVEVPTLGEEAGVTSPGLQLPTPVPMVPTEASVVSTPVTVSPTVAPAEVVQTGIAASSQAKSSDAGASLSLMALGTNKAAPVLSTGTGSVKPSTNMLDELYRQLGLESGGAPMNGYLAGGAGDGTTDEWSDMWELGIILVDVDSRSS